VGATEVVYRSELRPVITTGAEIMAANIAIYAISAHVQEHEAHLREVQLHAQELPGGSYGRRNRQAIADRETRITTRLRAIEHAYQTAIERDTIPEPTRPLRSPTVRLTGRSTWDKRLLRITITQAGGCEERQTSSKRQSPGDSWIDLVNLGYSQQVKNALCREFRDRQQRARPLRSAAAAAHGGPLRHGGSRRVCGRCS
jgi:hypothetical protein